MQKPKKVRLDLEFSQFSELLMFAMKHEHEYPEMADLANFLRKKVDKMAENENYYIMIDPTKTPEEREEARQKYLDSRGIPEDFRW